MTTAPTFRQLPIMLAVFASCMSKIQHVAKPVRDRIEPADATVERQDQSEMMMPIRLAQENAKTAPPQPNPKSR